MRGVPAGATTGAYDCPSCGETVYNDGSNQVRELATGVLHTCPPPAPSGTPEAAGSRPRVSMPLAAIVGGALFVAGCATDYGPLMLAPVVIAVVMCMAAVARAEAREASC